MSLRDWLANGWLDEHETNAEEIGNLLALVDRDLHDAQSAELSVDWRFNIACNAALQLAGIALAASGYRAVKSGPHHHRVIQSLLNTIGTDDNTVRLLDRFRKKHNVAESDAVGTISEQEATEILVLARSLRQRILDWLRHNHPALLTRKDPDS